MLQRLRKLALSIGVFSLIAAPFAMAGAAYADTTSDIQHNLACGSNLQTGAGCSDDTSTSLSLGQVMSDIINIFSIIVGFVAVIMIIVGGIRYVTSGGDSNNISGAKNTIIYAIIGLVIVALAQVLVHFVLAKLSSASGGGSN